ncbi:Protein of unknown function DUF1275 [Nannochloropsis gaditana]|uniref:Uncharacterized protein n=1 Tax=Nannochloropsis gaditana TaxID=72520 RepID=W7TD45_9STRA|nr:Protein of unknown function DUF1275 [Nannochloropsis gaditana]
MLKPVADAFLLLSSSQACRHSLHRRHVPFTAKLSRSDISAKDISAVISICLMPDRVPLVHRHRTPYHFHYEDEDEERRIPPSQGQEGSDPFEHTHIGSSSSSSHSDRPPSRGLSPPLTILRAKHPAAAALQHRPTTTVAHGHRSPSPTPKSAPPSLPPPKSPHGKKPATGNKPSPPPHLTSSWPWVLFGSLTLTINAGYINSITLHNLHGIPSAHVTGIVARASNLFAEADWSRMSLYVVAYCCFVSGACMGGLLISHETFYLGRNYARALFLTAAIQGVALVIESHWDHSVYFIYACCLAMGLQNSLTSKYRGGARSGGR